MLKGPVLNLSVLCVSVFQDRPTREHITCSKKDLKNVSTKKVENDISPKHVKVKTFNYFLLFHSQFLYFGMGLIMVNTGHLMPLHKKNYGPILISSDRPSHFWTDICRTEKISTGPFSTWISIWFKTGFIMLKKQFKLVYIISYRFYFRAFYFQYLN